ncbi:hypothetical protein [Actinoallomurus rhizosphaericola]|uniref:hypothetical protein n=1 Tax=Actinoallomurus rhizosphaericola TaxID=2952536 RepID=UPI0020939F2C|nr:hypothetical protein [Actinoallomurus rhizosphaericola]MCO5998776.1 hypothetical protein [Actinoallomurus rhizosphaericola]
MTTASAAPGVKPPGRRPQSGPPLLAPVLAFTALTMSLLTLLASPFGFLLPVVRFGGTVWLVAVAALPPRTRPSRHQ